MNEYAPPARKHTRQRRARSRMLRFALILTATLPAGPVRAQGAPRIWLSGWAGRFTEVGGISDAMSNAFYGFDDAFVFGGGVHVTTVRGGPVVGVDVLFSRPSYRKFDRTSATLLGTGDASTLGALASVRLHGGGAVGFYLSGGAGIYGWDLDDPDLDEGRDIDPALQLGAGLEYAARARYHLFAEYGQLWVYHQKDEMVARNTSGQTLLRIGARVGI